MTDYKEKISSLFENLQSNYTAVNAIKYCQELQKLPDNVLFENAEYIIGVPNLGTKFMRGVVARCMPNEKELASHISTVNSIKEEYSSAGNESMVATLENYVSGVTFMCKREDIALESALLISTYQRQLPASTIEKFVNPIYAISKFGVMENYDEFYNEENLEHCKSFALVSVFPLVVEITRNHVIERLEDEADKKDSCQGGFDGLRRIISAPLCIAGLVVKAKDVEASAIKSMVTILDKEIAFVNSEMASRYVDKDHGDRTIPYTLNEYIEILNEARQLLYIESETRKTTVNEDILQMHPIVGAEGDPDRHEADGEPYDDDDDDGEDFYDDDDYETEIFDDEDGMGIDEIPDFESRGNTGIILRNSGDKSLRERQIETESAIANFLALDSESTLDEKLVESFIEVMNACESCSVMESIYQTIVTEAKNMINDKGEKVPEVCPKCGAKVGVFIKGEPVYLCTNKKCGKYFGTVPSKKSSVKEGIVTKASMGIEKGFRKVDHTIRKNKDAGKRATAAIGKVGNTIDTKFNDTIDKIVSMDANERREKIIKGGLRLKLKRIIRFGIVTGVAASFKWWFGAVALIGQIAADKTLDMKYKREIVDDIEDNIKMLDEKIEDAKGDSNKQAKYQLMRQRNALVKERDRIRYNARGVSARNTQIITQKQ